MTDFLLSFSQKSSPEEAVNQIKDHISSPETGSILYFVSSSYEPSLTAKLIQEAFPDKPTFGCTTAGEIISGKMLRNSIVAMGIPKSKIPKIKIEVIDNLSQGINLEKNIASLEKFFGMSVKDFNRNRFVALLMTDGLSYKEEEIIDLLDEVLPITYLGGSAGDDLKFDKTWVFSNGKAYTDAAILVVMEVPDGFDILKTQSFDVTGKTFTVTELDESGHIIKSLDDKPASQAYSEALGISDKKIKDYFIHYPLGLMIGNEPFVRTPQKRIGNQMAFFCKLIEGMQLQLLESGDIVTDTRNALFRKISKNGKLSAIINFNCIFRTLELEDRNQLDEYAAIFSTIPTIGFGTYGETFVGHINQTSVMLLLK